MIFTPHWFHPHYDRTSIHDDPKDPTDLSASFCSSVAHLSKIETWRNAGKKRPKVEVSLVATRNLVSPTTPTMNSPSQKIHSCSKGGPDFGLTNLCYHVLVSDSVILPSHDYSSNVDLLKWWGSRSDEADLGGFWWSWPKKSVPFKMTSSQDLQQKLQGQLPRLQFEVLCENSQVTVSESSDLEFKCISASIYIYIHTLCIYIYMYMHAGDSWCFQSFYNALHLLLAPLICHTTRLTKSKGHEWSLPHWSREGLHLHIQNIRSLSRQTLPPERSWLDLKSEKFSSVFWALDFNKKCLVGLFSKKKCLPFLFEVPKGKEGSSHLPSTRSFNPPKKIWYDQTWWFPKQK